MGCVGLGVDLVGVERFARIAGRRGARFLDRVFTPGERGRCDGRANRYEAYAARFAAKEAFLKAVGRGLRGGIRWTDIDVTTDGTGRPGLVVSGRAREIADELGVSTMHVSLSHADGCAVAVVLLEG
jgi:holo-[acyl-carrier protein] synthase